MQLLRKQRKIITGPRVSIPKEDAEEMGIGKGDIIKVIVHPGRYPADDPIDLGERQVKTNLRISLEPYSLDARGISIGEYVDVEVEPTEHHEG